MIFRAPDGGIERGARGGVVALHGEALMIRMPCTPLPNLGVIASLGGSNGVVAFDRGVDRYHDKRTNISHTSNQDT